MSGPEAGLAPIVFFGYNRAQHATWALESIKACPECPDTPITIYMDGPRSDEDVAAVEAARAAVAAAAPRHAEIVYRDENMGLANSIRAGVTEACEKYGRVIVIEDDLVLAPSALSWFNAGLEEYEDDERVMHIAGFWPEPRRSLPPSFFLRWPGVWGWATWRNAWDQLVWDTRELSESLRERGLVERFNEGGWDFFGQLQGTMEGKYDSWGIRWYASVLLNDGLALHPRDSLVKNTGTDGSGVHGDESTAFEVALGEHAPGFPPDVVESTEAVSAWSGFVRRAQYVPLRYRVAGALRAAPRGLARWLVDRTPASVSQAIRLHWHSIRIRRLYGQVSRWSAVRRQLTSIVRPRRTVLFYPQLPIHFHLAFKACALLDYRMTSNPGARFDVAFKRQGATWFDLDRLDAIPIDRSRIVNGRSGDIGKKKVGRVFERVFGYSLDVDPLTHVGPMVEKADENARHDGRILDGPISKDEVREDAVYQRVLEHQAEADGLVIDLRVPVYGRRIPLVYAKYRTLEKRFGPGSVKVEVAKPSDWFTEAELELLAEFIGEMDIDYGELDVVRDGGETIYVVDSNNTPAGPPGGLPIDQGRAAMGLLSEAFETFLDEWMED